MVTVSRLLAAKAFHDICTISPEATVYEAIQVFAEHNLGALLVVERGALVGLISERDYARKVVLKGLSSKSTQVRAIMSDKVISVSLDDGIERCMDLMINKHIRHLPVLEGKSLVGIISIGDVVKAVLEDKEFLIGELVGYITDQQCGAVVRTGAYQAPSV